MIDTQPQPSSARSAPGPWGRKPRDPSAFAWASGALIASAAIPMLVAERVPETAPVLTWILAITSVTTLLLAGLLLRRRATEGRVLATVGSIALLGLAAPLLVSEPALTLFTLVSITGSLVLLWEWGPGAGRLPNRSPYWARRTRGSALVALFLWPILSLTEPHPGAVEVVAVAGALSASSVLSLLWLVRHGRGAPKRSAMLIASILLQLVLTVQNRQQPEPMLSSLCIVPAATLLFVPRSSASTSVSGFDLIAGHPERLFVGTFAAICALGTLALALPISASSGASIGVIDALFTSVSAVCVTGLIVLDTPTDFSKFGHVVLLLLIQTGGLGIMTFSTAALRVFRRRMSLRHETAIASIMGIHGGRQIFSTAQSILTFTLIAEGVGAAILTVAFSTHGDPLGPAAFRGVFTAVSAFCNAGFALQSDSLLSYQSNAVVLHIVGILIILGGLGPMAVAALPALALRRHEPVAVQSKLGLVTTLVLLLSGFALFLAFEWDSSLAGLETIERLHNAWFSSVTLRTAGFNSVELAQLQPATVSFMMVWMFVGGTPGGTAGGLKTTTAAVLVLSVIHAIRGQWEVRTFGRRISERSRSRASVVATLALSTFLVALLAFQLTQSVSTRLGVFEVVSALATVGLSLGATAELDTVGKLLITACMFVGRVGGLSVLMFLNERQVAPDIEHPVEDVDVG